MNSLSYRDFFLQTLHIPDRLCFVIVFQFLQDVLMILVSTKHLLCYITLLIGKIIVCNKLNSLIMS